MRKVNGVEVKEFVVGEDNFYLDIDVENEKITILNTHSYKIFGAYYFTYNNALLLKQNLIYNKNY